MIRCFMCNEAMHKASTKWRWVCVTNASQPRKRRHLMRVCWDCCLLYSIQDVFERLRLIHAAEGRDIEEPA